VPLGGQFSRAVDISAGPRLATADTDDIEIAEPGRDYGTAYTDDLTDCYYWRSRPGTGADLQGPDDRK
jgi:hypothetical protein